MKKKCNSSGLMKIRLRKKLLTMKFFVLFFLLSVSVSATTYSQDTRLTLSMENVSLTEVFSTIRKNTSFTFIYNVDDVRNLRVKSLNVKDATVQQVLDEALQGMGFIYRIEDNVIVIQPQEVKEEKKSVRVKGFVYDMAKQPMPGVTVKIVGVSLGTATDAKGWFALDLPLLKGALEFSFVGFKKQVVEFTEKTDTLRVTLEEEISDLDEVVVRAYGTQNKREMISAISSVKAEEMKELPSASITSMLQGRLAGLQIVNQSGAPGSAAVVAVRGFNSLIDVQGASDGQPLYVVDGIPMNSFVSPVTGTNTLADLDPSMIESVEVLKDAAAASIYGSRAGNGVIMITTKKGRAGKTSFAANVSYSVSQLMAYPEQTGGRMERWLDILYMRNHKEAYYDWKNNSMVYPSSYVETYQAFGGVYDEFWGYGQEEIAYKQKLQDSLNPFYNNSTNWWKYAFRTGKVVNANVQASGGTEKFSYMVGIGYYDETGIMINSNYSRANLISNVSISPNESLRMEARVYLSYVNKNVNLGNSISRGGYEGISVDPRTQSTLLEGNGQMEDEWLKYSKGMVTRSDDYRLLTSAFLEYRLWKGLTISASANVDYSQANLNKFTPSTLSGTANENTSAGNVFRTAQLSTEELLHYNASFNDVHSVDIMLGYNANKEQKMGILGYGRRQATDNIYYYNADENSSIYNYGTESNPNWLSLTSYSSSFREKSMVSFFGRMGYNYKQRYLLEVGFRRDGSSTFGENNKWANFPSVALGWAFSDESFVKKYTANWLNWGKIRASFGTSGQVFSDEYLAYGSLGQQTGVSFDGNAGIVAKASVSPDLTWEKTEQYNLGLDLDMFEYRLGVKLDYYYKLTKSLLYTVNAPGNVNAFNVFIRNAMEISNEGLELEMTGDIVRGENLNWRMKFNISRNWNRFRKSYDDKDKGSLILGKPLYQISVYKDNGFYQSEEEVPVYYKSDGQPVYLGQNSTNGPSGLVGSYKIEDLNQDGAVGYGDNYYAASALPVAYGGWVNEVKWRNFDLSMLCNYSLGRHILNTGCVSLTSIDNVKNADIRNYTFWQEEGAHADLPQYGIPVQSLLASKIERVNYFSLKQLTLGYNLSGQVAKQAHFSGVRIFATVENLFYLTNYSYKTNPETVDIYTGLDDGSAYPLPRKWTLGLTLNF